MKFPNILALTLFMLGTAAMPLAAQAQVTDDMDVTVAPPPPHVEEIPSEAPAGQTWSKGYWVWKGDNYVWVAGHWIDSHPGQEWVSEHWVERDGRWHFVPGAWKDRP